MYKQPKQAIWTYSLENKIGIIQSIDMPMLLDIMRVGWINGPVLWALVEPNERKTPKLFRVYATGEELDENYVHIYLGTYLEESEETTHTYVWHVFKLMEM